jgi:hypothetical protein
VCGRGGGADADDGKEETCDDCFYEQDRACDTCDDAYGGACHGTYDNDAAYDDFEDEVAAAGCECA